VRRLIINADDFGLTHGVNRAIAEGHVRGVVTSTTLMANSRAFDEAVLIAKSSDKWSVGCHLVLVDGEPLIDPGRLPTLVPGRNSHKFRDGVGILALQSLAGRVDSDQVEAESIAQIRKLQASGINVSHVDTHKHTHIFPGVLDGILRAARICGVSAIRNPFESFAADFARNRKQLWKRYVQVRFIRRLGSPFRKAVQKAGMRTPDGTFGIVVTGHLDRQLFQGIAENIPEGTWEFVCHPGYLDEDLQAIPTRLRESRTAELELLTSRETREVLASRDVELITYRDL
jgi:hopanoid biosynthesis associated protein HpnK